MLPRALESCILRREMLQHTDLRPHASPRSNTPHPCLCSPPEVLLLLEIPAREAVRQAPWQAAGAAFLFIFKMLTTTLCPWIGFLLWAFLSALVKLNHFVTRQEPGPALSLRTRQQLILPLRLLAATCVPTACHCVSPRGGTACSRQGWSPANRVFPSSIC